MSTEVQPPSPPTTIRSPRYSSSCHVNTRKKPLPIAFETQAFSRRNGERSSSFSSFVSRILPSHRKEKGHTLRIRDKDDVDAAVDPAFGVSTLTYPTNGEDGKDFDGVVARKTKSWSPGKDRANSFPTHDLWADGELYEVGANDDLERGKKTGTWLNLFHLKRKEKEDCATVDVSTHPKTEEIGKRGEGSHLQVHAPNQAQQTQSQLPMLLRESEAVDIKGLEKTKVQQMFDDKKVRRQQRKSLRESGDFLGVQGANPRTGYWDVSTATSSSDPSRISEDTKKKLDEDLKVLDEHRRRYEKTQLEYQTELARVQTLKDDRRREKDEKRRLELKLRQRKHGKWQLGENGWSSVAEPDLSPIEQSLAGTPTIETGLADRLFPMPSAAQPNPYLDEATVKSHEYFALEASSTLPRGRSGQHEPSPTIPRNVTIRRKPVGSPTGGPRNSDSAETIIRNSSSLISTQTRPAGPNNSREPIHIANNLDTKPKLTGLQSVTRPSVSVSPSQQQNRFLGRNRLTSDPVSKRGSQATVISYQLVSKSQVVAHPLLPQSPRVLIREKRVTSLNDFPPISLKDPITARTLSNPQLLRYPQSSWVPPARTGTRPDNPQSTTTIPTITTPITTTTGCAPLRRLLSQFDGPDDTPMMDISQERKSSRIPVRGNSLQTNPQNAGQSNVSQARLADTVISSENHLNRKKQRSARLYQMDSRGKEKVKMRSIPISTSMFPQGSERLAMLAPSAALLAFRQSTHQGSVLKTERPDATSRTPQKVRNQEPEGMRDMSRNLKKVPGGREDIGNPSRTREEVENDLDLYERRLAAAAWAGGPEDRREDGLVVWCSEPRAEKEAGQERRHAMLGIRHKGAAPAFRRWPTPALASPSMGQVLIRISLRIVQTAWYFVEPVFDPRSGIRRRWEQHRLTWRDACMFFAAALFTAGIFLITLTIGRVVGMVLQVVRLFMGVLRALTGF